MEPGTSRDFSGHPFDGRERSSVAQESSVVPLELQWVHALVVGEVVHACDAILGVRAPAVVVRQASEPEDGVEV